MHYRSQRPEGERILENCEGIAGSVKSDGFKDKLWHISVLRESKLMICGIWTFPRMALIIS